jgi:hypothetical protein
MADDDDDLLARAKNETALSIDELPPCCAPGTVGFRLQIISLLMSDACQDMKFRVSGVLFNGFLYRCVANAFREPRHNIHIQVVSSLRGGRDAEYDNKVLRVLNRLSYLDAGPDLPYKCQTVIHECTHACIDAQPGLHVWRTVNEVAGYFAGFLWRRGQGYPIPDPGKNNFVKILRDLADDARKVNVRGEVFILPDSAVDALKPMIVAGYGLSKDFEDIGKGF